MTKWFDSIQLHQAWAFFAHRCLWCGCMFHKELGYKVKQPRQQTKGFYSFWVCKRCGDEFQKDTFKGGKGR